MHITCEGSLAFFPSMQHSAHDDQEFPKRLTRLDATSLPCVPSSSAAFHVAKRNSFHKWNRLTLSCGLCDCKQSGQIMQIKALKHAQNTCFQFAQGAAALEHTHTLLLLPRYTLCYDFSPFVLLEPHRRLHSPVQLTFPFHKPRHLPFHCHTSFYHHLPTWLFLILISDSDSLCLPSYLRCLVRYFDPLWQAFPRPFLYLTLARTMTEL